MHAVSLIARAIDPVLGGLSAWRRCPRQCLFALGVGERRHGSMSSHGVITSKVQPPSAPALTRDRIAGQFSSLWTQRLGLIVAPAGYGKTTAMTAFAASAGVPVAWYRVEAWDAE